MNVLWLGIYSPVQQLFNSPISFATCIRACVFMAEIMQAVDFDFLIIRIEYPYLSMCGPGGYLVSESCYLSLNLVCKSQ